MIDGMNVHGVIDISSLDLYWLALLWGEGRYLDCDLV